MLRSCSKQLSKFKVPGKAASLILLFFFELVLIRSVYGHRCQVRITWTRGWLGNVIIYFVFPPALVFNRPCNNAVYGGTYRPCSIYGWGVIAWFRSRSAVIYA